MTLPQAIGWSAIIALGILFGLILFHVVRWGWRRIFGKKFATMGMM